MRVNAEKLMTIMAKKCIGVADLARKTELPQSTIIRYTHSRGKCDSLRIIGQFCKALEIEPSEITD